MGYGDALMAAGQAQEFFATDPERGPIAMLNGDKSPRWNPVWLHNPAIWVPGSGPVHRHLISGRGHLPYLHYPYSTATGWSFTDWRVRDHRPVMYLSEDELGWGQVLRQSIGPYVILEPTAQRKHSNRRPPRQFWDTLRLGLKGSLKRLPIVQLAHPESTPLHGTIPVVHTTFREACSYLASSSLLVTTEGGLAHAAAALGIPAVVLWGGNISEPNLGYPEHVNFVDADPRTPCGTLLPCDHCAQAWARLDPVDVAAAAAEEFARGATRSGR